MPFFARPWQEYVKTQLQLQQEASSLFAGADRYRSSFHCASVTVRERGLLGLYRGGASWFLFAGPRSAVRFGTFEALSGHTARLGLPERYGKASIDTANGFFAGIAEAALCQTPNQVLCIKLIHDQSPRGPKQYSGMMQLVGAIWKEHGLLGFFQGVTPAVAKGATTNAIRFLGYGQLKALMQGPPPADGSPPPPLTPLQSLLAGGTAGAVSAVLTQPIDTVKANMMGLEATKYTSTLHCVRELVRAGGVAALMNGVGPRVVRGKRSNMRTVLSLPVLCVEPAGKARPLHIASRPILPPEVDTVLVCLRVGCCVPQSSSRWACSFPSLRASVG